jgi:hypothetical protein
VLAILQAKPVAPAPATTPLREDAIQPKIA